MQILVYADSLSWGIVPATRARLPFAHRWPGVLERELNSAAGTAAGSASEPVRVVENCLNGRRTVWDDPFKPGRSGVDGIGQVMESHAPLALVILMLGTNDFQSVHQYTASHSAQGIARLIGAIRDAPVEPGMPQPPILVVVPPPFGALTETTATKFDGAARKSAGLAEAYRAVCAAHGCDYFDAGDCVQVSALDGVHLDADQHAVLGKALAVPARRLIR